MYTVLKSKRLHLEIPEADSERISESENDEFSVLRESTDKIVSSCFLDDVFVLFLFNSGRYLVVDTHPTSKTSSTQKKKSTTIQSQIVYHGHILHEHQKGKSNQIHQNSQETHHAPPKKLLPKNSLKIIEQSYTKLIFSQSKRIKTNECIIITKHSSNVFWLKMVKQAVESIEDLTCMIRTEITQLPGTMFGDILRMDNTHSTLSMTVLTELVEFDNTGDFKHFHEKGHQSKDHEEEKGSFFVKNEIIEDKMIYFTIYTRIPENVRSKFNKSQGESEVLIQLKSQEIIKVPYFIVTKLEYPIPINQVNSNFVIEVSDKKNNEIAIYKQSSDDQSEWEILLYNFGFKEIGGLQIISNYRKQFMEVSQQENLDKIVLSNPNLIPKPKIIILPSQFTSSIFLQQIIRIDKPHLTSRQANYLIISINQTFVDTQQLTQNQITQQQQGQAYRVNGQLVYFDENGNIRPRRNSKMSSKCWVHLCKLIYHQENSLQFTQWIQRVNRFKFEAINFLKIINVNYEQDLLYVLKLAHERVDGQLYENKIEMVSIKTGKIVEKGYLSLKNFSFSSNQKQILDVSHQFSSQTDFFYHIRLLFNKKSLYAYVIENSHKYFQDFQDINFIETVLAML